MNVEDLKAEQHQIEVRFEEIKSEVSEKESELARLQGEWRAYNDMITKQLEKDSASTIVAEEKKEEDSGE